MNISILEVHHLPRVKLRLPIEKKWSNSPFLCRTIAYPTFSISDTTAHKNLAGTVITYSSFSRATR